MSADAEPEVAEAPSAEAPAAPITAESVEAKKVPKPDEDELKEKLKEETAKIEKLQEKLDAIKNTISSRDSGRSDNSELAAAKSKYNDARAESRRLLQEKRNIYDQISAADELRKQQQDLTQRLRSELSFFSVEDVERRIKALEHQQQTTTTTVKEDKKILEEIKRLSSNKPMIKQFDEATESLKGVKEHHNNLYAQLKQKNAELATVKEEEEKRKEDMEAAREKDEAKKSDIPGLFKERDSLRKSINEKRDEMRKMRDEFNEQRKAWFAYQKAVRDLRNKEWQERKAIKQAEWEAQKKLLEEEEAKRDPWEEEKAICDQLISWVEKYLPKKVEEAAAVAEVTAPQGMTLKKKEVEEDPFGALGKGKKGKKGKGGAASATVDAKPKAVKISLSPSDFGLFDKLSMKAPSDTAACPALYEQLLAKKEWLKTAPPKPKKKKDPPPEEAKKEKEDAADTFDLAAHDKAELEKKKAEEAKKQAEKDALEKANLERAAELEKAGKRAAGGMHKFDPDEVDVNGGSATADDFMDAFGF